MTKLMNVIMVMMMMMRRRRRTFNSILAFKPRLSSEAVT